MAGAARGDWRWSLEWLQVRAVRRRHIWRLSVVPVAVCVAMSWGWLFGVGWLIGWIERLGGVDVWGALEALPEPLRIGTNMLLGCFVPLVGAPLLAWFIMIRQACSVIARYRDTPACPFCGYDLSGVEPDGAGARFCPECGERTVPFDAAFDWWHTLAPRQRG